MAHLLADDREDMATAGECSFCLRPIGESDRRFPVADHTLWEGYQIVGQQATNLRWVWTDPSAPNPFDGFSDDYEVMRSEVSGAWPACPECAAVIDAGQYDALAGRLDHAIRARIVENYERVTGRPLTALPDMGEEGIVGASGIIRRFLTYRALA